MRGIAYAYLAAFALLLAAGCAGPQPDNQPNPAAPPGAQPQTPSQPAGQAGALTATPSEIPHFTSGQFGYADFTSMISDGTLPYHCQLTSDSALPDGLILADDCSISGTRTLAPGTPTEISPPFTVLVTDSSQPVRSTTLKLSITTDVEKPTLAPRTGYCTVGEQCKAQVADAYGGTEPYTFSSGSYAEGGAPPQGLAVGVDGYLIGTPSSQGAFSFSVCVKDSVGMSDCGETQVVVAAAQAKSPCYIEGFEEPQYPGQPICCQKHVWCDNWPDGCCHDVECYCYT